MPPRCARAWAPTVRSLKQKGVKTLAWWLAMATTAAAAVEGAILGNFEPDLHKTTSKESKSLEDVSSGGRRRHRARCKPASSAEGFSADAQNFTRDLVNEPANLMTPMVLADRARAMAAEVGLECEVLDQDRMRQLGMGSLLGVAQGSAEPPALIIVRYRPASQSTKPAIISGWSAKASPSIPAASPSSPPRAWRR